MKKLILVLISLALLSCASTKPVNNSKKMIKGSWTLNSITHNNTGVFNIKLLNDSSKQCFENSDWQFIPNNNTGTYAVSGEGCSTDTRHFVFTIEDNINGGQSFLLKPTNKKSKSETNDGFRLQLSQLTENSMILQQTVNVDGSPFKLSMNFTKNQ